MEAKTAQTQALEEHHNHSSVRITAHKVASVATISDDLPSLLKVRALVEAQAALHSAKEPAVEPVSSDRHLKEAWEFKHPQASVVVWLVVTLGQDYLARRTRRPASELNNLSVEEVDLVQWRTHHRLHRASANQLEEALARHLDSEHPHRRLESRKEEIQADLA